MMLLCTCGPLRGAETRYGGDLEPTVIDPWSIENNALLYIDIWGLGGPEECSGKSYAWFATSPL